VLRERFRDLPVVTSADDATPAATSKAKPKSKPSAARV